MSLKLRPATKMTASTFITLATTAGLGISLPTASAGEHCRPHTDTEVRLIDSQKVFVSSGRWDNPSDATITSREAYEISGTVKAEVHGEGGVSVDAAIIEVNGKISADIATSVTVTAGVTREIKIPPHSKGSYEMGIEKVRYAVDKTQTYSNCDKGMYGYSVTAGRQFFATKRQ